MATRYKILSERELKTDLNDNSDSFIASQKAVKTAVDAKQDTLVSGTNIKTVNSTSLLGSGDIAITVPTKAAGSDLDTGTDDAKFATAKAIKDSHNVPSVAPGTSGNVLTSDGTDWTSAANSSLPLAGGTMTGEITLGENAAIVHDNALSADGKYTGEIINGTAGATLAFGDLVYLDPTDSRWELADANVITAADGDCRGILAICVLAAANDGSATKLLLRGMVRADAVFPTFTVNAQVYVSETAGDVTETAPTTADSATRVVGFGYDGNTLYFCPSPDYITHT